jgi:exonuclease SbcC
VEAADRDAAALRTALRTTRDPLVVLGAPACDDSDVRAAWIQLADWAGEQTTARAGQLTEATTASSAVAATSTAAQDSFNAAAQAAEQHRAAESTATAARERCAAAVEELLRQHEQLTLAVADAPSKEQAERDLAHLEVLEAAVRAADAVVRAARATRQKAETAAGKLDGDVSAAWQALRAARDELVPLGAPGLDGTSVLTAWTVLAAWAAARAGERADQIPVAIDAVAGAEQHLEGLTRQLTDALAAHDVELPGGDLASTAPPAVARALEQSRAAAGRVAERRTQAVQLLTDQLAAETDRQVAKKLADMLRSDQFPRWLVASALDALVLDASETLRDLSGGQFELTHKSGEFYVIDHADADSLRSVRTLSGGETFQASLALALALSTQISALSAGGAARLDSIFLDEGFGTLDEATLEIVAETLENLAHGERMVGVITHVTALAERVPVRFAVHRDARTSTVIRESA